MKILLLAWLPFALMLLVDQSTGTRHPHDVEKQGAVAIFVLLTLGWGILLTTVYVITRVVRRAWGGHRENT